MKKAEEQRLHNEVARLSHTLHGMQEVARENARSAEAEREKSRIAIGHLRAVLATAVAFDDGRAASNSAEDWLTSIGSEPS